MNIKTLKLAIKDVKTVILSASGKESLFSQNIKLKLPSTNFQLIGEELCLEHANGVGKCDMWLANCPNKFLVSLELKIDDNNDIKKQELLVFQMHKYSQLMKEFYPMHTVYGLGAYKYSDNYKFFDNLPSKPVKKHILEIDLLKNIISKC
jgi:hypothetical protein